MAISEGAKLAYSVSEAAEALGIGRSLVYELMASGRLSSLKLGSRRLILHTHLEDFLRTLSDDG
jgi:excisionase family DNA binding protein